MRSRVFAAALAGGLAVGVADAADAKQQFYIMGEPGTMTCATLTTKLNDEQAGLMLGTWIAGYATALNRTTDQTYNVLGGTTLETFFNDVIATCTASPDSHVEAAVYAAVEKAFPSRQTKAP